MVRLNIWGFDITWEVSISANDIISFYFAGKKEISCWLSLISALGFLPLGPDKPAAFSLLQYFSRSIISQDIIWYSFATISLFLYQKYKIKDQLYIAEKGQKEGGSYSSDYDNNDDYDDGDDDDDNDDYDDNDGDDDKDDDDMNNDAAQTIKTTSKPFSSVFIHLHPAGMPSLCIHIIIIIITFDEWHAYFSKSHFDENLKKIKNKKLKYRGNSI